MANHNKENNNENILILATKQILKASRNYQNYLKTAGKTLKRKKGKGNKPRQEKSIKILFEIF